MDPNASYRDLLVADLALVLGIAPARDVAYALQRYWEKRAEGASVLGELRAVADLSDESAARLEAEVAALVAEAGGDPRLALGARGGLDRSIHLELSMLDAPLSRDLAPAGIRTPLRPVPGDRYLDFSELGRGGMGVVYLALDSEMNRRIALKVVRPQGGEGDSGSPLSLAPPSPGTPASEAFRTLSARFLQEAWVTGGLEHPGIVPVYEVGRTEGGVPYYTMRFVKGERTLEKAVAEAVSLNDRLALLEPFLKLCDTVGYAHAKGVIHRDLKPSNVALGEFGEVVLLDWGLAKLKDRPDVAQSLWQGRIREFRETEDLQTVAGALGTPGYMSPEAVLGDAEAVDERSDVYSLGAILYRVFAGRLPFDFRSFPELIGKLLGEEVPPPHEVDPAVPEGLSRIAVRALARDAKDRTASVKDLAEAVRAWQRESAVDREVRGLLDEARSAWSGAEGLQGDALLGQIDRVLSRAGRALELRPGETEAETLVARATAARDRAIAGRERAARRGVLKRVAVAALVVLLMGSGVVAFVIDGKRRQALAAERRADMERARAEEERERAEAEKEAKQAALSDVLRLSDVKKVADLIAEAEGLWPVHPDQAPAMADFLARAREVLSGRTRHEATLAALRAKALPYTEEERLRDHATALARIEEARAERVAAEEESSKVEGERAEEQRKALEERVVVLTGEIAKLEARVKERAYWRFDDPADSWQQGVLSDLLAGMVWLADGERAILKVVEARHVLASGLAAASIAGHEEEWREVIAAIADETESPMYRGLRLAPILGLVPLGRDPDSGLQQFAHLGSGTVPARDAATGRLTYADDAAIVLVLIPGGTFRMGAQKDDPAGPNFYPQAEPFEGPVREVTVPPYLIGKHECTQAQWAALTEGSRPSQYGAGVQIGGKAVTDRNPVEQVDWIEADRWLSRHRLRLPSEAEWEYACRAGTETPWWTGREAASLQGAVNLADAWCRTHGGPTNWSYTEEVDDGQTLHAPVGSYRPNAFGLHDMVGNVFEWCADWDGSYGEAPRDGTARSRKGTSPYRVARGGSWGSSPVECRSAVRSGAGPSDRDSALGFRPAASLGH